MIIIGLSGGVASGKNFVAEIFAKNGAVIFDADKEVHELMELDELTFQKINKFFPQAIVNQKINRKILGEIVFFDKKKLEILEKILHPKIRKKYQDFLKEAKKNKKEIVILNIPLLLEKGGYKCDKIISIIAPKAIRKERFLLRSKEKKSINLKNLKAKFEKISSHQISDLERKKKSDFIIKNNLSESNTILQIKKIIYEIKKK